MLPKVFLDLSCSMKENTYMKENVKAEGSRRKTENVHSTLISAGLDNSG